MVFQGVPKEFEGVSGAIQTFPLGFRGTPGVFRVVKRFSRVFQDFKECSRGFQRRSMVFHGNSLRSGAFRVFTGHSRSDSRGFRCVQ